jgi:hypothetical protein
MTERRGRMRILIGAGALLMGAAFAGCAGMGGSHIDCNVVKLQSQSGRSNSEIASALGVSESDVSKCPPAGAVTGAEGSGGPPNASEYGIPAGMEGGGGEGGASAPAPPPSQ